ncbi:MAG: C4-dicarboxylate ABC transporter, partial [Pseudomonadota bacterium]
KRRIIEAGGVVRELTQQQRQAWVTALQPVWARFEDEIGTEVIAAARASNDK